MSLYPCFGQGKNVLIAILGKQIQPSKYLAPCTKLHTGHRVQHVCSKINCSRVLPVAPCFRNHPKGHVGHFSHAEKETQARLDELHMETGGIQGKGSWTDFTFDILQLFKGDSNRSFVAGMSESLF